ncbi:MAG: hypothetical protein LPJ87_06605 [Zoogloeaceae bacterium]|nr:hypothetical protein [Zoogloeaceae bacterium]
MDSTTVYAKTDLGHEEVATRVRHIPARMRTMLIMVDGRSSVGQLLANHPTPDEARGYLESLLEGGFIAAQAAPVAAAPPSVAAAAPATGSANLGEVKQVVTRLLLDFIGPDAEYIAIRIEKITSRDELAAEVDKLGAMLESSVGHGPAARFRESVLPMLA